MIPTGPVHGLLRGLSFEHKIYRPSKIARMKIQAMKHQYRQSLVIVIVIAIVAMNVSLSSPSLSPSVSSATSVSFHIRAATVLRAMPMVVILRATPMVAQLPASLIATICPCTYTMPRTRTATLPFPFLAHPYNPSLFRPVNHKPRGQKLWRV